MIKEGQKLWDAQHKMMEEWLEAWKAIYQPLSGQKGGTPAKGKKKGENDAPAAVAEGQAAMMEFTRHWAETQEKIARKWWDVFREASWLPGLPEQSPRKPFETKGGFWKRWISWMESFWPTMEGTEKLADTRQFLNLYADWLSSWYKMWGVGMGHWSNDNPILGKYFSTDAFRNVLDNYLKLFPAENWKAMLDSLQNAMEQNVAFLNDIDLPFDEIAGFWDRMLVRFTPVEDTQLFTLGNQINQYMEVLANPFFAIAGSPRIAQLMKQWRLVQFHYWSFLIKNAELRGKVLEASMAVFPEALKNLLEEVEAEKTIKLDSDFYGYFFTSFEQRVSRLMKSEEYVTIQNELSEIGVQLKASLDDWFELVLSGLPVLTRRDEDDIAKELESLRVKLRKLNQELKKEPKEKLVPSDSLN